jgi:NAD(P)-dependent dehydrogenase (short-subunit alcohol dehydrogenase family)
VFSQKVSIITGAASGIGRACAHQLAQQGSQVVLVDLNAPNLSAVASEIEAIAGKESVLSLCLNITSEADMAEMARATCDRYGRIDILIASAGILRVGGVVKTIVDTSLEEWQKVVQINLTGTFLSNRAVLPTMLAQKQGDIVNISSVSGRQGRAFDGPYCASKAGIIGFSESLAEEVSAYGVRIQTLLPDAVDTPLWDQNGSQSIRAPQTLAPEQVAAFIVYLLSLPPDTCLLNPVITPMKSRKKRSSKRENSSSASASELS